MDSLSPLMDGTDKNESYLSKEEQAVGNAHLNKVLESCHEAGLKSPAPVNNRNSISRPHLI